MDEINKYICKDVCTIIDDYLHGDKEYWTKNYNKCMNEILTFNQSKKNDIGDYFIYFMIMG